MIRAVAMAALLLPALVPGSAAADFSAPPELIEFGSPRVQPERLVANDRGDRVVVYRTAADTLRVAFAPAGQPFGEPQDVLESSRARDVQVAIGPAGDALIAWGYFDATAVAENADFDAQCCIGQKAAVLPRGGPVGATATPWPRGTVVDYPIIDIIDRRHFGIVARTFRIESVEPESYSDPVIQARFSTRRGGWGPTEHVASTGNPRALAISEASSRLVVESSTADTGPSGVLVERSRSRAGRWGQARRLLDAGRPSPTVAIDRRGDVIVVSSVAVRDGVALRAGTVRPGRRPRLRIVDRVSRGSPGSGFGGALSVAPNGTALVTWAIGTQWYRSERPAGRTFGARRLAFAQRAESTPYSFAVSSRGRWVAGITAGAGFTNGRSPADDPPRVRAITARFGGRASGSELVTADYRNMPMDVVPPVIDRAGRITFVTAVGGSLAADVGR